MREIEFRCPFSNWAGCTRGLPHNRTDKMLTTNDVSIDMSIELMGKVDFIEVLADDMLNVDLPHQTLNEMIAEMVSETSKDIEGVINETT